jgi:hypothetical protein
MANDKSTSVSAGKSAWLSLDSWAVIIALALALAVKFGVIKTVPW